VEGLDVSCEVQAGEVLSISDPRLHYCAWPVGLTLTAHVVEVAPSAVVVEFIQHHLCEPTPDEREAMRKLWREAAAQAREKWGDLEVESKQGSCTHATRYVEVRRIDGEPHEDDE
jgi:hypothetical protein